MSKRGYLIQQFIDWPPAGFVIGDITTLDGLGVANSKMLAHLFELQPEAVSLHLAVRSWIRSQGLDHLRGYTICLLVLFYLQANNMMPTIQTIQQGVQIKTLNGLYLLYRSIFLSCHYISNL